MFFPLYGTIITLLLTNLSHASALLDTTQKCDHDSCLRSFEAHASEAKGYCARHPNPWYMAPAPEWAGECHSLGRLQNKRVRLASACRCFYGMEATATAIAGNGRVVEAEKMANGGAERTSLSLDVVIPTGTATAVADAARRNEDMMASGGATSTSIK